MSIDHTMYIKSLSEKYVVYGRYDFYALFNTVLAWYEEFLVYGNSAEYYLPRNSWHNLSNDIINECITKITTYVVSLND